MFRVYTVFINYIFVVIRTIFINKLAASILIPNLCRFLIHRVYGIETKSRAFSHSCYIKSNKLKVGWHTFINANCFFDNDANVEIGDKCNIAMECMFLTSTHDIGDNTRRAGKNINLPIKIGKGVWIGARTTILPGVTIGDGCILASGSVVSKDCEPNGLYAGVPARRIRELTDNDEKSLLQNNKAV